MRLFNLLIFLTATLGLALAYEMAYSFELEDNDLDDPGCEVDDCLLPYDAPEMFLEDNFDDCGSVQVRDLDPAEQKRMAKKGCDPANSKGLSSLHNCFNGRGKHFFCRSYCVAKGSAKGNYENGECFP